MHTVPLGVEEAACRILERLGEKFSDGSVDYESFAGLHSFTIRHAGTRFRVQFAEQTLVRKSIEQIEETIAQVTERVLFKSTLRPLRYTS